MKNIKKLIIITLLMFFTFGSFNISNALDRSNKITKIMNNFYSKLERSTLKIEKRIKKLIIIRNKINVLKRKKLRQQKHNHVRILSIINKSLNERIKLYKLEEFNHKGSIFYKPKYNISIDFADEVGEYKDLLGVNKAPLIKNKSGTLSIDISNAYEKFGISEVRMHDDGLDLCEIYGSKNIEISDFGGGEEIPDSCKIKDTDETYVSEWKIDNDVNNLSKYNFTGVAEKIRLINDAGAKLYLRLGESWGGPNNIKTTDDYGVELSEDDVSEIVDNYATVAKNIFKYYNGGFLPSIKIHPDIQISAVEIHNEGNSERFWKGNTNLYHNIIKESIIKIKNPRKINDNIPVGAAGFTQGVKGQLLNRDKEIVYNFIKNVGIDNLDFLSVHYYGDCSDATLSNFYDRITGLNENIEENMEKTIENGEVKDMPIHITEWNIGTGKNCTEELERKSVIAYNTPHMFSYVAGMLLLFQKAEFNIEHSLFYSGQGSNMGLFTLSGTGGLKPNKGLMAFDLFKGLDASKLVKTYVEKAGSLYGIYDIISDNITARGFKTNSGGYKVVIVNDNSISKEINLDLKNLDLDTPKLGIKRKTTYSLSDEDVEFSYFDCGGSSENKCIDTDDLDDYINSNKSVKSFNFELATLGSKDKKLSLTIKANSAIVLEMK